MIRKNTPTATAMASATTIDHQMPSIPHTRGSSMTAAIWNTSVRKKEMMADVNPSFSAVKKPEKKMGEYREISKR